MPATPEAWREYRVSIAIVGLVVAMIIAIVYFDVGEERREVPRTEVTPRVPCYSVCSYFCSPQGAPERAMQRMCDDCKKTRCDVRER